MVHDRKEEGPANNKKINIFWEDDPVYVSPAGYQKLWEALRPLASNLRAVNNSEPTAPQHPATGLHPHQQSGTVWKATVERWPCAATMGGQIRADPPGRAGAALAETEAVSAEAAVLFICSNP